MAYISESRKDYGSPWRMTLCLTTEDCKQLLPSIEKRWKEVEAKFAKYNDIHEMGEATTRQQDLLLKYEEEKEALAYIIKKSKELINDYNE